MKRAKPDAPHARPPHRRNGRGGRTISAVLLIAPRDSREPWPSVRGTSREATADGTSGAVCYPRTARAGGDAMWSAPTGGHRKSYRAHLRPLDWCAPPDRRSALRAHRDRLRRPPGAAGGGRGARCARRPKATGGFGGGTPEARRSISGASGFGRGAFAIRREAVDGKSAERIWGAEHCLEPEWSSPGNLLPSRTEWRRKSVRGVVGAYSSTLSPSPIAGDGFGRLRRISLTAASVRDTVFSSRP